MFLKTGDNIHHRRLQLRHVIYEALMKKIKLVQNKLEEIMKSK